MMKVKNGEWVRDIILTQYQGEVTLAWAVIFPPGWSRKCPLLPRRISHLGWLHRWQTKLLFGLRKATAKAWSRLQVFFILTIIWDTSCVPSSQKCVLKVCGPEDSKFRRHRVAKTTPEPAAFRDGTEISKREPNGEIFNNKTGCLDHLYDPDNDTYSVDDEALVPGRRIWRWGRGTHGAEEDLISWKTNKKSEGQPTNPPWWY